MAQEEEQVHALKNEDKWVQEDQLALEIIHSSLSESILEAYSHCETTKDLWESLKNIYGNLSNLSRVFEVKRIINNLSQEGVEFNLYFGNFSSLWAELDMLRPFSTDPDVIRERYEQDKVFSLLLNLSTSYNQLIKHILRQEKLPDLDDVCVQIQKEQISHTLFTKERKPALKDMYNKSGRLGLVPGYKKTKKRHVYICYMYSALSSDSNGGETWNKTVINDGPIRMSDIEPLIKAAKAIISAKKSGNVVMANGDRVKIEGIGNLKLFDRESTAFYMPSFAFNLLYVKKATVDLNCQEVFRPNDVEFQDLKTG
ncbi:hypothetical protein N665_1771s0001 [Sinapis alba]|nr:hypothetical protein N665_1771s0001 [Sinapis alba]